MGLPIGVTLDGRGQARARVWAPEQRAVEIVIEGDARRAHPLAPEADGYFAATVPDVRPGMLYRFRVGAELVPDPASRYQPRGPEGPSCVVDPAAFPWTDGAWRGRRLEGQVVYEMHVGTFTREGTWSAARARLPHLADLGVGVIEMLPVADFPGDFGWGYDGVSLFAPTRLYGAPDDLRAFVDAAHALGIAVILDVVYNHFGPTGSPLLRISRSYASKRHATEWGPGFDFDGPRSGPVRDLVVANAAYWIEELHFDGLRLDATQSMFDESPEHVVAAVVRAVREAARGRETIVVAENEPQEARLARPPARGGLGVDALWNDDFHHTARVALTGLREAYYRDYEGGPQEIVSALKHGFLFQGQRYAWQNKRRGSPALDLEPRQLVTYLENHDQVANSAGGRRLHQIASPGLHRAMVAVMLLAPSSPMLFQGEEFASSAPFAFFADHPGELGAAVEKGRREFVAQFPSLASAAEVLAPPPGQRATFEACKLDWAEREAHGSTLALYKDLIALRRTDATFAGRTRRPLDGAVLGPSAFVLRFFGEDPGGAGDRLVLVDLAAELRLDSVAEPLLAPPSDAGWDLLWSSEAPAYGGRGTPRIEDGGSYTLPGRSAVVLAPARGATP